MAELDVICWKWGDKYEKTDVIRLANSVKKHLSMPYKFHVFTDKVKQYSEGIYVHPISDRILTTRSCFCRLRMFDAAWQEDNDFTGKIISLDLDLIIIGSLDKLFDGESTFKILQGVNAVNPCPFNASVMMLKAGKHAEVWKHFSLDAAAQIQFHEFPDDQGWIWHKLPDADGWKAGKESGIYGFQKPGWPEKSSVELPDDAKIVAFIGKRKPNMYMHLPWMRQYWIENR